MDQPLDPAQIYEHPKIGHIGDGAKYPVAGLDITEKLVAPPRSRQRSPLRKYDPPAFRVALDHLHVDRPPNIRLQVGLAVLFIHLAVDLDQVRYGHEAVQLFPAHQQAAPVVAVHLQAERLIIFKKFQGMRPINRLYRGTPRRSLAFSRGRMFCCRFPCSLVRARCRKVFLLLGQQSSPPGLV